MVISTNATIWTQALLITITATTGVCSLIDFKRTRLCQLSHKMLGNKVMYFQIWQTTVSFKKFRQCYWLQHTLSPENMQRFTCPSISEVASMMLNNFHVIAKCSNLKAIHFVQFQLGRINSHNFSVPNCRQVINLINAMPIHWNIYTRL